MLSFMKAQATFFHQGQELYQDCEPYMKDIASQVRVLFYFFVNVPVQWDDCIVVYVEGEGWGLEN